MNLFNSITQYFIFQYPYLYLFDTNNIDNTGYIVAV